MPDKVLHNLVLPQDKQLRGSDESRLQQNQATQGILNSDSPQVEGLSLEPGQQVIRGQFHDPDVADQMAAEFEELFEASGYDKVAFFTDGGASTSDGYYELRNANVKPVNPRVDGFQEFDGIITFVGTNQSYWRSVETNPSTVVNPFGSASTALVGAPAAATKVRWYDTITKQFDAAAVDSTATGEFADVDLYDAAASSLDSPTLIYEIDYNDEWPAGCLVWDTYGNASKTDVDGNLQWQRVFRTDHGFAGLPYIENGVLRLVFDEANNTLSASRWDDTNSQYSSVSLGTSDWQLFDLNLRRIGDDRVTAQVEFEDSASPGTTYNLDMALPRGYDDALWYEPPNESSSTPSGLVTKLDPIAHDSDTYAAQTKSVLKRTETDR